MFARFGGVVGNGIARRDRILAGNGAGAGENGFEKCRLAA
jgi:hypothetical protein